MSSLLNLNPLQQQAATSTAKRLLVLAGAGSGKTKTLIQKLIYLTEEEGVQASSVLAITFTKNATNEMIDRLILSADTTGEYEKVLNNKQLTFTQRNQERYRFRQKYPWIQRFTIRTFHSFCYMVLQNHGVKEFDNQFKLIGETKVEVDEANPRQAAETNFEVMHRLLIEACEDREIMLRTKRYIIDYFVDRVVQHTENSVPAFADNRWYTTLKGDKVRSKSEQYIADWLYRHSIRYEYEPKVHFVNFAFKPDFYIPDANVFIEHISDKSFPFENKEREFKDAGRHCFITHESMASDSALFNRELDRIVKNRLPQNRKRIEILSYEEEFKGIQDYVAEFIRMGIRVMDMLKVDNTDVATVKARAEADPHERVREFYALMLPLLEKYKAYCINKSYLDFNDLILLTIQLFRKQPEIVARYRKQFRYVLVDEFQDVNNLQIEMLMLLLEPETQLFCVGDDWQSIYGFRGSNVSYIVEFEKHFENAEIIRLDLNYRSTAPIVDASNEVIKHNKFQLAKQVKSSKPSDRKLNIFVGDHAQANVEFALQQVKILIGGGIEEDEILFLYRRTKMMTPFSYAFKRAGIRVNAKTIHAAKGLEAKVVFVIGLTEGHGGFPDIWLDDRIFQMIKPSQFDLLMEEERRLFYVALTRAKDQLFLLTEKGNESSFLKEIPKEFAERITYIHRPPVEQVKLCPSCESQLQQLYKFCPYCGFEIALHKS
jgi:DNA helicase IV